MSIFEEYGAFNSYSAIVKFSRLKIDYILFYFSHKIGFPEEETLFLKCEIFFFLLGDTLLEMRNPIL